MHADRWAHANVECGENVSRVEKNVTKCGKKVENWREKIIIQKWSVSKLTFYTDMWCLTEMAVRCMLSDGLNESQSSAEE